MTWWHAGSVAHKVNNAYRVKIRMFLRSNIQPDRKTGCFPGLHLQLLKRWSWPLKARYVTVLQAQCDSAFIPDYTPSARVDLLESSNPRVLSEHHVSHFSPWNIPLNCFQDETINWAFLHLQIYGSQTSWFHWEIKLLYAFYLCFLFMFFIYAFHLCSSVTLTKKEKRTMIEILFVCMNKV